MVVITLDNGKELAIYQDYECVANKGYAIHELMLILGKNGIERNGGNK